MSFTFLHMSLIIMISVSWGEDGVLAISRAMYTEACLGCDADRDTCWTFSWNFRVVGLLISQMNREECVGIFEGV